MQVDHGADEELADEHPLRLYTVPSSYRSTLGPHRVGAERRRRGGDSRDVHVQLERGGQPRGGLFRRHGLCFDGGDLSASTTRPRPVHHSLNCCLFHPAPCTHRGDVEQPRPSPLPALPADLPAASEPWARIPVGAWSVERGAWSSERWRLTLADASHVASWRPLHLPTGHRYGPLWRRRRPALDSRLLTLVFTTPLCPPHQLHNPLLHPAAPVQHAVAVLTPGYPTPAIAISCSHPRTRRPER